MKRVPLAQGHTPIPDGPYIRDEALEAYKWPTEKVITFLTKKYPLSAIKEKPRKKSKASQEDSSVEPV